MLKLTICQRHEHEDNNKILIELTVGEIVGVHLCDMLGV